MTWPDMAHTVANLEHHHFKHAVIRRPGAVHVFGAAPPSFNDGFRAEVGDVFEIKADAFGRPLHNPMAIAAAPETAVRVL